MLNFVQLQLWVQSSAKQSLLFTEWQFCHADRRNKNVA